MPFLALDSGETLREGPAIVQYIADQAPEKKLAPSVGAMARYQLQSWLNFIGTELHKGGFGPLFNPAVPTDAKQVFKDRLLQRLIWVDGELAGQQYLMGDTFTVTNWTKPLGLDIGGLTNLNAYRARVAARPAVQAAKKAEGLM